MITVLVKVHEFVIGKYDTASNSFVDIRILNFLTRPSNKEIKTLLQTGEEVIRSRKIPMKIEMPEEILEKYLLKEDI